MVADQVHPFLAMVFANGSVLFQKDNALCLTAKIVHKYFEEHYKEHERVQSDSLVEKGYEWLSGGGNVFLACQFYLSVHL